MSELTHTCGGKKTFRWQLLTTASVLPMLATVYGLGEAQAADQESDRPTIWVELGGQLERQSGQGDAFAPPFVVNYISSPAYKPDSPLVSEKPPLFSNGAEGKITFEPDGSDWVFSAKILYGRANGDKKVQDRAPEIQLHTQYTVTRDTLPYLKPPVTSTPSKVDFSDTRTNNRQSYLLLDFEVGKDVGLGMFGPNGTSMFSAGVRIAQFVSKSSTTINAIPDLSWHKHHSPRYQSLFPSIYLHNYRSSHHEFAGTGHAERSFHGVGPSISWDASLPFLGNQQIGELTFDWGANAALLFGRQRASGRHQESGHFKSRYFVNTTQRKATIRAITPAPDHSCGRNP